MARGRLDPELRRQQILDAAAGVYAESDPSDVTFEEIADAAGVSRGLVYNYFGDKGGLIAAVYLRSLDRLDDVLRASVDPTAPPQARTYQLVRAYVGFAEEHASGWRLIAAAGATRHRAVQAARRARIDGMAASWGGGPQARTAAAGLVGLLESATLDWLDSGGSGIDELAATLAALVWSGLAGLAGHGVTLPERRELTNVVP